MRAEPRYLSKVVSQALYAEEVQIYDQKGEWFLIETPDGYKGWTDGGICERESLYPKDSETARLRVHVYATADTEYGPLMTLPFGVGLHVIDDQDPRWIQIELVDGREVYIQKGDVLLEQHDLISLSKRFLGLPYTWGGRSSFGYDCSGYVQMLFSRMGIQLPRDARQQILDPRAVCISFEQLKTGDLIFWGKSEQEIKHVGMSLGGSDFIHTSSRENKPFLRTSSLNDLEWSGNSAGYYPFRVAKRII